MGKDPKKAIKKQLAKANQLFKANQYKKAGRFFNAAGNSLLQLKDYENAKKSFSKAVKAFINEENALHTIEAFRNGATSCLFQEKYIEASEFFKEAINYIPNLRKEKDRNSNYILFSTLSYLCLFLKGKPDKGFNLIKKIKPKVNNTYFKENPLVHFVTNLTISLRDLDKGHLNKIEADFVHFSFRKAEEILAKRAILLADAILSLELELNLDKELYTTLDIIHLTLDVNTGPLMRISENPFYNYEINQLQITNILITLSDNLITQKKPKLPVSTDSGKDIQLEFQIRPNFQLDDSFIGPISMNCIIDEKYDFFFTSNKIVKPNLISPPPTLEVSIKSLRPPLIDQTFPMEILIENKSEGEALDISIKAIFPEQLKIMRGTTEKQLYAMRSNEKLSWEINLKPIEAGDYIIQIEIKFKDQDQNPIEISEEFPLSIKL